jgi:hypothetical protein
MKIDMTLFWQVFGPLAVSFALAIGTYVAGRLGTLLKLKSHGQAQANLDSAMQRVGQLAFGWFLSLEAHNKTITIPPGQLASFAAQVVSLAPSAAKTLGISTDTIGSLVQADLTHRARWDDVTMPLSPPPAPEKKVAAAAEVGPGAVSVSFVPPHVPTVATT